MSKDVCVPSTYFIFPCGSHCEAYGAMIQCYVLHMWIRVQVQF
jgi:hypothetical protein